MYYLIFHKLNHKLNHKLKVLFDLWLIYEMYVLINELKYVFLINQSTILIYQNKVRSFCL
jgi:hypothetical protein